MKSVTMIALAGLVLAGCAGVPRQSPRVTHIVLCWLKDAGNETHRRKIIEVSRSFSDIPGVLDVRAGEVMASDRKIVDDSFDVAISISFANRRDLESYLAHPIHARAKQDVLMPLVKRILVYDFKE